MFKTLHLIVFVLSFVQLIVCEQKSDKSDVNVCGQTKAIVFKESEESHRMIEMEFKNDLIINCFIYGDKQLAEKAISQKSCSPEVKFVDRKELSEWGLKCSKWLQNGMKSGENTPFGSNDFPNEYNNKIDRNFFDGILIFPETKWCGAGNVAEHEEDLGPESETDMCCRSHDLCFDSIEKWSTKYNLTNTAIHTKSHCYCDEEFKQCLHSVNKEISQRVSKLYFNLIQVQCFKKDHPIVECLEYKGFPFFWKSCQKYVLDYEKPVVYQFFDALAVDY